MKTKSNEYLDDYSFCLFRIPKDGARVIWEITNLCNYTCSYCIFSSDSKEIPEELNTNEVFNALDDLKSANFTHLKFTGGEPFARNDFMNILEKSKNLGFIIDVSTNASLIDSEKASKLKDYNLQMVHVSVDGHDKITHEEVRGYNTYDRTITGLKNLVENDIYVRIGTVIFKGNENRLENMIQSAVSLGVNEIIFSFMEPVGKIKNNDSLISKRSISNVKSEIEALAESYKDYIIVNHSFNEEVKNYENGTCPAVNKFLFIDNLGKVSPCPWVVQHCPEYKSESTLKNSKLNEVLESSPIEGYLSVVRRLDFEGIRGCPVRLR
jgi:MoaA/NifB/PqqE/SkfB family radical SAM enzyme